MKQTKNRSKTVLSLIALSVAIPISAIAGNVRVQNGNVRATIYSNDDITVTTGRTSVSVPARRRTWYPWRYWRTPWRNSYKCHQSAYQQTTQTNRSGSRVTHHSSTSSYCR